MTEYEKLFEEAEQLYESGHCAEARDLYRQVLMQNPEHRLAAANLAGVEQYEAYLFRASLRKQYPNSLGALLLQIHSHKGTQQKLNELIGEALASPELTFRERFNLHFLRFENACKAAYDNDLIVQDFRAIWALAETHPAPVLKRSLLRYISSHITNRIAIPALETLARDDQYPESVRAFLQAKISELEALNSALEEIPYRRIRN